MKKVIKVFSLFIVFLITMAFTTKVSASSATFSVRSSASTVAVGNNVTVTVTLSSGSALGSWNFTIGYDTSKLKLVSSTAERDQTSAGVVDSANQKSVSYKYTFKTLTSGNANVNISDAVVYDFNDEKMSLNKGSASITIKTWQQIEASYSTNADLKGITIKGGELNPDVKLTPDFDKNNLEYSIELEPDTTSIEVGATKADSTASVSGTGAIEVSEGTNKIEIVVTAQKGNTKTYVINAIVKELSPINETLDGVNYTVVRKQENLVKPYSYTEDTVMIDEIEVPAFYSSITGYKLVGLKDETGNIKLFIYDETNGTYKYYQELSLGKVVLATLTIPDDQITKGYKKSKTTINNEEVECIVDEEYDITLVYGKNIETGDTKFYIYDKEENTLQRYFTDSFNKINKKINLYTYVILGLGALVVVLMIIIITIISKNNKKLKERKEEMKQEIITAEVSEENKQLSKKEKKMRTKELKRRQRELEILEKRSREKIENQEQESKEEKNGNDEKKDESGSEENKTIEIHTQKDQTIPEFELEPSNRKISKKDKNKHKKDSEDDDMFML